MAEQKPLLLVDGSSYLFRAFNALPDLRTWDDFPTGAIRGVIGMLRKLQADYAGSPVAVVFDAGGRTFRDDLYAEYKANRPPMADDLRAQVQPIFDIVEAMGMPLLRIPGVEADDVIGTLAADATRSARRVIVSTGDKDLAQLVSEHVTLVNTMTETTLDREGVIAKHGVPPERIIDYLALMGDSTDNIPGVPKVGTKTAAKWLGEYGSLDEVIAHAHDIKGKVGENLRASVEQLPLSRELTTIRCDVPLDVGIDELTARPPDTAKLRELFERFEFKPWLEELGGVAETAPTEAVPFERILSADALAAFLAKVRSAGELTLCFHTAGARLMDRRPVGVALQVAGEAAYVPVGHDYVGVPEQVPWDEFLAAARPLLEDPAVAKTGQDLKAARNLLARFGVSLAGIRNDTMLESYVLDSVGARRHHLEDVAGKYLGVVPPSYEAIAGKGAKQLSMDAVDVDAAGGYAAGRVAIATRLHGELRQRLEAEGTASVYEEIDLPLVSTLSRMECRGALVDAELLAEHSRELAVRMEELTAHAYAAAGEEFNLGSTKQLQEILYDKLGLPALKKTQKGQRSTAEPVLQEFADDGHELPRVILEYRAVSKLKSTYTDALPLEINAQTGRIHTSYNQAVAATGRLSSADPNLQNIPIRTAEGRRIRKAFVAPPGKRLIAADYSQIELRIMAHLSGDEGLLRAFERGDDIHRATAAEVFGASQNDVTDEQRRSAKAINFGLIYGMSAFGLAAQLNVGRGVARQYIDRYFERYPGVKTYMERARASARADGFVETVFGRRLYLPEIRARHAARRQAAERAAINAPMQGTAADIVKRAMVAVDGFLENAAWDAAMVMQVHDELVLEVAEADTTAVAEAVRGLMRDAAELAVELVVDVGVGRNWDEAH